MDKFPAMIRGSQMTYIVLVLQMSFHLPERAWVWLYPSFYLGLVSFVAYLDIFPGKFSCWIRISLLCVSCIPMIHQLEYINESVEGLCVNNLCSMTNGIALQMSLLFYFETMLSIPYYFLHEISIAHKKNHRKNKHSQKKDLILS